MTSTGSSSRPNAPLERSDLPEVPDRPESVRAELRRLGIRPTRSMGQSFLVDPFVADAESALFDAVPGTRILEIGPGFGVLTRALLTRGFGPITLIEKDRRLAAFLREHMGARVTVVEGDALEMTWPPTDLLGGNLPFSIATAVITRALELRIPRWVVMVQREVGNRICSGPGSRHYGRLSVLAALYGKAELFLPVTSEAFYPTPKVDGVVIRFDARADPLPVSSVPELEAIVRGLFHQRRKQLGNILPRLFRSKAAGLAEAALWPHDWQQLRPEQLSPDAFFRLAQAARTAGAVPTLSSPSKAANPLE